LKNKKPFGIPVIVTVEGKEAAKFIAGIKQHLPDCVQNALLRANGKFLSWEAVKASIEAGYKFIIANQGVYPGL